MLIPVPALAVMSPTAVGVLMGRIAHFAALAQIGEEYPITIVTADREEAAPVVVVPKDSTNARTLQILLAGGYLKYRDDPTEVVMLMDSFMATYAPDGSDAERARTVTPRNDPQAVECLVLSYASPRGTWFVALPYGRGDNGRIHWERPAWDWKPVAVDENGDGVASAPVAALHTAIDGPGVPADLARSLEEREAQEVHGVIPLSVL